MAAVNQVENIEIWIGLQLELAVNIYEVYCLLSQPMRIIEQKLNYCGRQLN